MCLEEIGSAGLGSDAAMASQGISFTPGKILPSNTSFDMFIIVVCYVGELTPPSSLYYRWCVP